MDTSEVLVIAGGITLIALTLWYFFGERTKAEAQTGKGGTQEVTIRVQGAYSPDTVVVQQGVPVRLNFKREETSSCSEQVVFGDFGIVRDLPAHQTTTIEFTPSKSGEFFFTCGMGMLRGKLIVR